jgi:exonuclease VII small subunit
MVKRKKRLEKGIASLNAQIKIHEEKIVKAIEEGNMDLEGYYRKEIESLKKAKERKEDKISP